MSNIVNKGPLLMENSGTETSEELIERAFMTLVEGFLKRIRDGKVDAFALVGIQQPKSPEEAEEILSGGQGMDMTVAHGGSPGGITLLGLGVHNASHHLMEVGEKYITDMLSAHPEFKETMQKFPLNEGVTQLEPQVVEAPSPVTEDFDLSKWSGGGKAN